MGSKVCFKCKEEKDIGEFYKHKMMADGHLGKCKDCTKRDVRERRRENPAVQEYDRRRYRDNPERKAKIDAGCRRRRQENPAQYRAHAMADHAIRKGDLVRPDRCSRCNGKGQRIEAHHEDYSRPLDVVWLCSLCHRRYT